MDAFLLVLLLLAAVLLSSLIDQVIPKVSLPLVQIALGIIIALVSLSPVDIDIVDPNLFLVLFIAPLIFDESKRLDKASLWKNRKPVASLAIGLVVAAALATGFLVNLLIPSIPLAAAFALGAALGPTDAVAVSSLSKETRITSQQKNVLEAESIINDASGIVSFQFAIAAAVTGAFSLLDASISFVFSFVGGIALGIVMALILGFLIRKIRDWGYDNITFHVLIEVCLPFVIFLTANALGVSGILALIAAGFMNVTSPRTMGPAESRLNIVSTSVWRVITFVLNGIVFILLGIQLPSVMRNEWEVEAVDNVELIGYVFIITIGITLFRFLWVLVMRILERRKIPEAERPRFGKEDLRHCGIMTFAGARGAITLALVLTIPFMLSGNAFPQRSLIIFIASGVIILTLLMATFIVPIIAPKKKEDEETHKAAESAVMVEILSNVIEELTARQTTENRGATQSVIRSYNQRIARIRETNDSDEELDNKELRLQVLRWEQEYAIDLMDRDEVDPAVAYDYINRVAHVQNLIKHKSDTVWMARSALRRPRLIIQSLLSSLSSVIPGSYAATERVEKGHVLHIQCIEHVIGKLQEQIADPNASTPEVSELLSEYQRTLTMLRTSRLDKDTRISVTEMSNFSAKRTEVQRIGLMIELEEIQNMYEAERLSRATTKRMRENVSLMQIDLEDHV